METPGLITDYLREHNLMILPRADVEQMTRELSRLRFLEKACNSYLQAHNIVREIVRGVDNV